MSNNKYVPQGNQGGVAAGKKYAQYNQGKSQQQTLGFNNYIQAGNQQNQTRQQGKPNDQWQNKPRQYNQNSGNQANFNQNNRGFGQNQQTQQYSNQSRWNSGTQQQVTQQNRWASATQANVMNQGFQPYQSCFVLSQPTQISVDSTFNQLSQKPAEINLDQPIENDSNVFLKRIEKTQELLQQWQETEVFDPRLSRFNYFMFFNDI